MSDTFTAPRSQAFYTANQVAILTGLSYKSVLEQIHAGAIPYQKFGATYRIPARRVNQHRGDPEREVHVTPEQLAVSGSKFELWASVLDVLAEALQQVVGLMRDHTNSRCDLQGRT